MLSIAGETQRHERRCRAADWLCVADGYWSPLSLRLGSTAPTGQIMLGLAHPGFVLLRFAGHSNQHMVACTIELHLSLGSICDQIMDSDVFVEKFDGLH